MAITKGTRRVSIGSRVGPFRIHGRMRDLWVTETRSNDRAGRTNDVGAIHW